MAREELNRTNSESEGISASHLRLLCLGCEVEDLPEKCPFCEAADTIESLQDRLDAFHICDKHDADLAPKGTAESRDCICCVRDGLADQVESLQAEVEKLRSDVMGTGCSCIEALEDAVREVREEARLVHPFDTEEQARHRARADAFDEAIAMLRSADA